MSVAQRLLIPAPYPSSPYADDPEFTRAAEWLSRPHSDPMAIIVGVPFSGLSLSGASCDLLPKELRAAMWGLSTYDSEHDIELSALSVQDAGDISLRNRKSMKALDAISAALERFRGGPPVVLIGGDNSITAAAMPVLAGVDAGLLTFDAHHDVRDHRRDGPSNGSPVRMLLDSGVSGDRIIQIGINAFANSSPYSRFARESKIRWWTSGQVSRMGIGSVVGEAFEQLSGLPGIYVDFDLDVVEKALAPGAPAAQPGGLSPADVVEAAFACGRHPKVTAIDIVEVDPTRDVGGATVKLACLVLLSFLAGVASRS